MVKLRNNFNITNLFLTKEVSVFVGNQYIYAKRATLRHLENRKWLDYFCAMLGNESEA